MHISDRFGGYITVEASFVFPIVMFVILAVLNFGFDIYNRTAADSRQMYLDIRAEVVQRHYFDTDTGGMDIRKAVNGRIFKTDDTEYGVNGIKNSTVVRLIHVIKNHVGRIIDDDGIYQGAEQKLSEDNP